VIPLSQNSPPPKARPPRPLLDLTKAEAGKMIQPQTDAVFTAVWNGGAQGLLLEPSVNTTSAGGCRGECPSTAPQGLVGWFLTKGTQYKLMMDGGAKPTWAQAQLLAYPD
jgi:hypothetical protein